MPNWCFNQLFIEGNRDKVKKCVDEIGNEDRIVDFNELKPYPLRFKLRDMWLEEKFNWHIKDGFNSGGYQWCVNNWGTKWNARYIGIRHDKNRFFHVEKTVKYYPVKLIKKWKLNELPNDEKFIKELMANDED